MIRVLLVATLLLAPAFTAAQSITIETIPLPDEDDPLSFNEDPSSNDDWGLTYAPVSPLDQPDPVEKGERASGAVLRALDKVSGETVDLDIPSGQRGNMFGLDIGLTECRYPAGNPAGDAFAYLVIREPEAQGALFAGWMVASSPALSALDHARYDVWVLRCITS